VPQTVPAAVHIAAVAECFSEF